MSHGAQAYARIAQTTASPREIEAQALLKAANKLQDVMNDLARTDDDFAAALLFNRKLWAILLSAVTSDENLQTIEVRQNIVNIGTFVLTQTAELQLNPQREKLKPLIDINCNLAAGLSGRA
jgi:flagellar protein FlaF